MSKNNTTIIICAAGMGTRLGIGSTKALINVCGKPLIRYQLELLDDFQDVRIVVGYQAERLINTVLEIRRNILFAFNYDYQTTGPLTSVEKAILGAKKYTVVLGGDMIIHPKDLRDFLNYDGECIGYSSMHSAEPVYLDVNKDNKALSFACGNKSFEWSGLVKFESEKFKSGSYYVHQLIQNFLPMMALETRGIDIDTQDDYDKVVEWVKSNYSDGLL